MPTMPPFRATHRTDGHPLPGRTSVRTRTVQAVTLLAVLIGSLLPAAAPVAAVGDFQLTITPRTVFLAPNGTVQLTVGGAPTGGFASPVTLQAMNLPTGVTASFSVNPLTLPGQSVLTLTAGAGLVATAFNVNVAATGGGILHFAIGDSATLDFDLTRRPPPPCQGSVTGILRNSRTGAAIANTAYHVGTHVGVTDGQGRYGPFDASPGDTTISADDVPGYWRATKSLTVVCNQTTQLDFAMVPWDPATISGKVVEGNPTGVNGATVVAAVPEVTIAGATLQLQVGPLTTSAANGSFLLTEPFLGFLNTPLTNAQLVTSKAGYWPRSTSTPSPFPIGDVSPGANGPFTVPLVRQCTDNGAGTTTRLSGRVTFSDGGPAPGITVTAHHLYKNQTTTTAADGTYTLDRVLMGYNNIPIDYIVSAVIPEFDPLEDYYRSGEARPHLDACGDRRSSVDMVLQRIPMGSIEGFVFDDSGAKVVGAGIGIASSGCRPCKHDQATSDANGHYRIYDIPAPSTWGVKYFDQFDTPFWENDAVSVNVVAGQPTQQNITIIRKKTATVQGVVRDAITGAPIEGARVVEGDDESTTTAANGTYSLTGLRLNPPDNRFRDTSLSYFADRYWDVLEDPIRLEKDQPPYIRNIDLIPVCTGVTLTGVVRDATTGAPIPFAAVRNESGFGAATADDQGRYTMTGVQVGSRNSPTELEITASKLDYADQTRTVEVFCGAKVAVGTPARVILRKATQPTGATTSFGFTGELGSFSLSHGESRTFDNLFPGEFDVQETQQAGWTLGDVTCGNDSLEIDENGAVTLDAAAGRTLDCTFTNQRPGTIVIKKETIPDGDPTEFEFFGEDFFTLTDGQSKTFTGLAPDAYSVSEFPSDPWAVQSVSCDDDDSSVVDPEFSPGELTVNLAAGETVICTFTNQRQPTGTIVIRKETDPTGTPGSFTFVGPEDDPFDLGHGEDHTITDLRVGEYNISESVPDGWEVARVTCDDDDSVPDEFDLSSLTVNLAANETVTCTFVNRLIPTETGTIVVAKTTDPAGDPTSFDFDGGDAMGEFSLADGGSRTFDSLPPGTYAVGEDSLAGWVLESATCDDGSEVDAIDLEVGDVVTCTFHNVRTASSGSIVIRKTTRPAGDTTEFSFTGDLDAFKLADGGSKRFDGLALGTYAVAETAIDGWDTTASCDDGSPVTAIDVSADEVVTCTFVNTKRPTLRIVKETDPASDPQDFAYTTTGAGLVAFSLDTDAADTTLLASRSFVVQPGTYGVTETLPVNGWDFTRVTCVSANGTSTVPASSTTSAGVSVVLAPGDTVTCTYRNTKRTTFAVVKTVSGQAPAGTQSFELQVRRNASPTIIGTVVASANATSTNGGRLTVASNLVPGTYQFCEFILPGWANPFGPTSFVPGIAADSTIDNAYQCVSVTAGPGTTTFTLDNRPPPGGQAKTIGFWKNWASCSRSGGNQKPILDQWLAGIPGGVLVGRLTVTTCPVAVDLLNKSTIGDPTKVGDGRKSASDPAFDFAAQFLAYRLNTAAGARSCSAAASAATTGQTILAAIAFDGQTHTKLSKSDAARLNEAAIVLDRYNNNTLAC
jgi:hypothetical protein